MQRDELEALQNIYMDDFNMKPHKDHNFISIYEVNCSSLEDLSDPYGKCVKLSIEIPMNYPYENVICDLDVIKNVTPDERIEISKIVNEVANSDVNHGEEIVLTLVLLVIDKLRSMNDGANKLTERIAKLKKELADAQAELEEMEDKLALEDSSSLNKKADQRFGNEHYCK